MPAEIATASVNIPKDVIEPIVQAQIKMAIIAALENHRGLVADSVAKVLNTKVNERGIVSQYSSDNKFLWLDQTLSLTIREVAKKTIEEWLEGNKKIIEAHLRAELAKKNSPLVKQLIQGMASGMVDMGASGYRINVTISHS